MTNNSEEDSKSEEIELTPEQMDVLQELGNIGSGNAITALSELIHGKVDVASRRRDFQKVTEANIRISLSRRVQTAGFS